MTDLNEAIRLKPDYVEALIFRGRLNARAKHYEEARADLEAASKVGSPSDGAILTLGDLYQGALMFDDALSQYQKWLTLHPDGSSRVQALNGRCWTRAVLKVELDKALRDCNDLIKLSPKSGAYYDSRGLVHLDRGELDLAIADYSTALSLAPKRAGSLYARGVAELRKGQEEKGRADMAAAVAMEPNVAARLLTYGISADPAPAPVG